MAVLWRTPGSWTASPDPTRPTRIDSVHRVHRCMTPLWLAINRKSLSPHLIFLSFASASYSPPCEEKKSFFFFLPANPRSAPPPPPPGYSPRPASPRRFGSLEGWHTGSATSGDGVLLSPWGRVSGAGRCAGEVEIDLLAGRRRRRLFFAGCILWRLFDSCLCFLFFFLVCINDLFSQDREEKLCMLFFRWIATVRLLERPKAPAFPPVWSCRIWHPPAIGDGKIFNLIPGNSVRQDLFSFSLIIILQMFSAASWGQLFFFLSRVFDLKGTIFSRGFGLEENEDVRWLKFRDLNLSRDGH